MARRDVMAFRDECAVHGHEPVPEDVHRICGECGHAWLAADLVREHNRIIDEIRANVAEGRDHFERWTVIMPGTGQMIEYCCRAGADAAPGPCPWHGWACECKPKIERGQPGSSEGVMTLDHIEVGRDRSECKLHTDDPAEVMICPLCAHDF